MAFDFKKEYKEFYMPKNKPEIVNVPSANYIAIRGEGNPNEEGGAYQQAISILYAVAYTLKMSYKTDYKIEGFFEYVVPPLEGFWWQDGVEGVDYANKSAFHWISVIRLPDFVTKKDFEWAVKAATQKKKLDCSSAEYLTIEEGLCVQIMHIGSFDDEPATVALMDAYLEQNGYVNDMNNDRLHHEIYMSDARKVAPEKWKTVIRHPIRKVEYNKCIKESFTVIGKEGSTTDGEDFIQKLWEDANSHFNEVAELAKKDEKGNVLGIWGAMSDMSRSFLPWEDGFTKGLYLAGVECVDNAEAPEGWTKWVVPGYEYFYVECEGENTFPQVIKYLEENNIPLVGAVHDFTCPQTGKNYMFFPIGRL